MNTLRKWSASWIAIIISLIVFFPFGLVLLIIRSKSESKFGRKSMVLIAFGILLLLSVVTNLSREGASSISPFTILLGLFCISAGINGYRVEKKCNECAEFVLHSNITSISSLSELMKENNYRTKYYIKKCIKNKQIDGYVDNSTNQIILNRNTIVSVGNKRFQTVENNNLITIKCKNCGADNVIAENEVKECEYCGSRISL